MLLKSVLNFGFWTIFVVTFSKISPTTGDEMQPPTCPSPQAIEPCICENSAATAEIGFLCKGPQIEQKHVNRLILEFRLANGAEFDDKLKVEWFELSGTKLTTIDLSVLSRFWIGGFLLMDNSELREILGTTVDGDFVFETELLSIYHNPLSQQMMNQILKMLSPETLREIDLFGIPNLETIDGGSFNNFPNLAGISITNGNLSKLDQDAFLLDNLAGGGGDDGGGGGEILKISLRSNHLSDDSIHPVNGLPSSSGKKIVNLDLFQNDFAFISADNFQPFLDANEKNLLTMNSNKFICDGSMRWLHDTKDKYQSRVFGVDCTNEFGRDIFNTTIFDRRHHNNNQDRHHHNNNQDPTRLDDAEEFGENQKNSFTLDSFKSCHGSLFIFPQFLVVYMTIMFFISHCML